MRVLIAHSEYLTGPASGENRAVADERLLLGNAGHDVLSLQPSAAGRAGVALAARAVWSRAAADAVRRVVRAKRPDVVHFHNLFPNLSPAVLRAAHAEQVPVVMTLHNFRLSCLPATFLRKGKICEDCLGRTPWRGVLHGCYRGSRAASAALATSLELHRLLGSFQHVDLFVVLSEFMRDKLVEGGLDPAKLRVRPNFAWPMPRRKGPGSYFLVLGRLSPEKGVDVLLEAWTGEGRLVVAGDGPERRRLEASSPPGVEFLGAVQAEAVPTLMADARALLLPSQSYEGSPRAVVEAMAAGVPVVGSDIGGIPEHVVSGTSGLLVEPTDTRGWASAIDRLRDDDLSTRLGEGAYFRWQELFSPETALASLEDVYRKIVRSPR